MEGVNLILSQVLVGLPSWVAVPLASWDRSPISGPSVFFLSPRPLRCFPSFGWVCFWSWCGSATSGCRCRLRLVWVHTAVQPSQGSVLILHPGFLFSGLVERGAFHRVPPPLSSFGMWSPLGSLVSFVTFDRKRRWPLEWVFLLCGSLQCRSEVVVSLRPRSLCHGS